MDSKGKAIIFMCLSAAAFAAMQVIIALTADRVPLFEQLFFRNAIAMIVAFLIVRKNKLPMFGHKGNRKLLICRSTAGHIAMVATFYAASRVDQGDLAIITRMSPFFVTLLAFLFLKEKIRRYQIVALLIAFTGAFIVANPQFNSEMFPIAMAFVAAVLSGVAYTFIGALKGKEDPAVVIFFFSLFSTLATVPFALKDFVWVAWTDMILLLFIGIFAACGQLLLTHSFMCSKASVVGIYNYSGILFSMLFGFLFLQQSVKMTSTIGAVLVVVSGVMVYYFNRKETD